MLVIMTAIKNVVFDFFCRSHGLWRDDKTKNDFTRLKGSNYSRKEIVMSKIFYWLIFSPDVMG